MSPDGIDQSWGYADPAAAAKAGVDVVSMYLSWESTKNISPAKVRAYHRHAIASMLNWESKAGAPLNGAAQGRADATEAVRQARALIKAVGYAPKNRPVIYLSCDRDVNAAQIRGPINEYYRAARSICHAGGFGVGCYGEADLVHYLAAQQITDAEWQTYAWSRGVLDPAADFYQYRNGQRLGGASVDFDRVIHPAQLGAWWPPGSPHDTAGDDDMPLTDSEIARIAKAVWTYPIVSPPNGVKGEQPVKWTAAGWLTSIRRQAYGANTKAAALQASVHSMVVSFDAAAAAKQLRDRFVTMIGGKA